MAGDCKLPALIVFHTDCANTNILTIIAMHLWIMSKCLVAHCYQKNRRL